MQYLGHDVWNTRHEVPETLRAFQDDVAGLSAISDAAKAILGGTRAGFITTTADPNTRTVTGRLVLARSPVDGADAIRVCVGENDDPDGAGSHSLIPSWYQDQVSDVGAVSAAIAIELSRMGPQFFRLAL